MSNITYATEISQLLKEIHSTFNQNLRSELDEKGLDLTIPQISIMMILFKEKRLKLSEISKKMSLANSTVSGIIDRLEKNQIVRRIRSEEDKRIVYIELTNKAEEFKSNMHNTVNHYLDGILNNASKKEIDTILEGLRTLKTLLI